MLTNTIVSLGSRHGWAPSHQCRHLSALASSALDIKTGDARWKNTIQLPSGVAVDSNKPRLPPHQVIFTEWKQPAGSIWASTSRRTGLLALKAGMTADWDSWGVRHALTVLKVEDVMVTGVITEEERGYSALQVGSGLPRPKELGRALLGQFRRLDVAPRSHLTEFRVTPDAFLEPGTPLLAQHFMPGQCVRVTGTSQGKGFQGAMKRHGFAGQGASHGNSVSHRVLGATGNRQDPGRVIKGKKMPGRMGGDTITMEGLQVYKIDARHNLIYIKGAVPGKPGTLLRVADSLKRPLTKAPPFPSYKLTGEDSVNLALWSSQSYATVVEEAQLEAAGKIGEYRKQPAYEFVMAPPTVDPFSIPENDEPEGQ